MELRTERDVWKQPRRRMRWGIHCTPVKEGVGSTHVNQPLWVTSATSMNQGVE